MEKEVQISSPTQDQVPKTDADNQVQGQGQVKEVQVKVKEDQKLQTDSQGQTAASESLQTEEKRSTKCVPYTERDKVQPKVKAKSKRKSKRKEVTGQQMVAYMQAQEKMRSEPVKGINTPKIQLKLGDIFSPLGNNICQPKSMKREDQEFQCDRADFKSTELVEITKGADFSGQNLGEVRGQIEGQKKSFVLGSCGVKLEVGSRDGLGSGNISKGDQRQSISLKSIVETTDEIHSSEQDPGQGGLCQNQP